MRWRAGHPLPAVSAGDDDEANGQDAVLGASDSGAWQHGLLTPYVMNIGLTPDTGCVSATHLELDSDASGCIISTVVYKGPTCLYSCSAWRAAEGVPGHADDEEEAADAGADSGDEDAASSSDVSDGGATMAGATPLSGSPDAASDLDDLPALGVPANPKPYRPPPAPRRGWWVHTPVGGRHGAAAFAGGSRKREASGTPGSDRGALGRFCPPITPAAGCSGGGCVVFVGFLVGLTLCIPAHDQGALQCIGRL